MRSVVIDASVVVKWIFADVRGEQDTEAALDLLDRIGTGVLDVVQPPHWLAEVAAVVTRLDTARAEDVLALLQALELPVSDDSQVYLRACEIGAELNHHVFDTLYHAVALCASEALLVTADTAYFRKANRLGSIALLRDLVL